ncbi:MAG: bifunctional metallophosphatase/5'-nucleotidase, partial [Anaerolineae bacterium]
EGYAEDGAYLILSGGDTWTGPAISSWFDGESMVEVMNLMGYDAVALGNHEFDFGLEGLRSRAAQAEFPFLGANVVSAATGEHPDAVLPYVIQEVADLRVGIVGLASRLTPRTTMPTHVEGLLFEPYAETLQTIVPQVKAEGADVILVIGHICNPEMRTLVPEAAELGVAMIGGGHCHQRMSEVVDGVALVAAGSNMRAYGRVALEVDTASGDVLEVDVKVSPNSPGPSDPDVAAVVERWQARLDDALDHVIGYTENGIGRGSNAMHNMVTDAWLAAYPADIAMTNPGGFRQEILPGEITLADVVGVLPFDNYLIDVKLTGEEVISSYQHGTRRPAVGGMAYRGGRYVILTAEGDVPLDPSATYTVLVNDFMYAGGDGYRFADYDPNAYETGIDWRQPVIEWISTLNTSPDDPVENYVDTEQR